MQIPMSSPDLTEADIAAVNQVLQTQYLSMGPRIEAFEGAMADYVGTRYAAAVNSGTSGLHLAAIAAGVGAGDEVITTPFSFVASANCILYQRARPVFVDIDPQTLNIDPALIEEVVTSRTRALLPVDVFGQPADYDPLREIAQRHGLTIIEDACETLGAEYSSRAQGNKRKAGTLGDVAVFAFYPNKQMTTGEGGVIVTDREDWDRLFRSLRNQGRDDSGTWLNHVRLGYNYRLDEMSAALGLSQLMRIEEMLNAREAVAQMYNQRLRDVDGVSIPHIAPTTARVSWFVYVVRLAPEIDRDAVMSRLHKKGIACRPYFTPIHLQPFYVERFGYRAGDFPVTEAVSQSTLALPFHNRLDEESVDTVCRALHRAIA
jgi:perosamine synthetase